MSLTASAKDELARVVSESRADFRAETSALLRFAGGIHLVAGNIVVEAELDNAAAAKRLQIALIDLYRAASSVVVVGGGGLRKSDRYVVRIVTGAEKLAHDTGLLDKAGRPIRGLPPELVSGPISACVAAWRGAFLARGSLTEPTRSSALEVTAPGPEAALALVGLARRLGANAKSREVRQMFRVAVRENDSITTLLQQMGATQSLSVWADRREKREKRGEVNRLANFDDANMRRSTRAAVLAGARVRRAFEILGDDIPEHLVSAGKLRLEYKQASLEELGQLSTPQLTKDAVAGRIRRLLAMADKKASELGIPDTESGLNSELLES
ncbi:MAG: DNA-binding protein WhiA [Mobiluncus porci]|uniref:Probable cell division protein WhiA n=1 Tax=Mobiluncus porci TaxID=2652278 RepID=A0A7K0K583_9ACTO|nr:MULTISPECIES: DNA-binding protein WhiA [Mobiluncus]MCI6584916.1 DNA-binding protein WhiA [Mobiluncus sp.]MDD7542238.1 DNA-binding protein WhiA [Mobiluncus porci]MDY5749037.1 DNA-binding protein WhiA [Mobiluncus porci]MST50621.1 DNA-binding protein WhiA [Mobiluncus porci]